MFDSLAWTDGARQEGDNKLQYSGEKIKEEVDSIVEHEQAMDAYFTAYGIDHIRFVY